MTAIEWFDWLQVALGIAMLALGVAFVLMLLGVAWHFAFHAGDALATENLWLRRRLAEAVRALQVADIHLGWGDATLENVHWLVRAAVARSTEKM